jgi:hypothetical protein
MSDTASETASRKPFLQVYLDARAGSNERQIVYHSPELFKDLLLSPTVYQCPRVPAFVDCGFGGFVEAEDDEVASAGDGGEPVCFFAGGRTEVEVGAAVGFCAGLSREPSDGNGRPLARPDAFWAS